MSGWNDPPFWLRFFRLNRELVLELTWRGVKYQWAVTPDGMTRI